MFGTATTDLYSLSLPQLQELLSMVNRCYNDGIIEKRTYWDWKWAVDGVIELKRHGEPLWQKSC